jgi:hypothetical protein
LFAALLFASLGGASAGIASSAPAGVAPTASFTAEIVANRTAAEPGESVLFTLWVNVSVGQIQFSRVNVSLDADLRLRTAEMTHPADCSRVSGNETFAEWQCTFLRAGRSYAWSLPAEVSADAATNRDQAATAHAADLSDVVPNVQSDTTAVWVLERLLNLVVYASPPGPTYPGHVVTFTINATNRVERSNDTDEVRNATAFNVSLRIELDPVLRLGSAGTPLAYDLAQLIPEDSLNVSISVVVLDTATGPDSVGIEATLSYYDISDRFISPDRVRATVPLLIPSPFPPNPSTYAAIISFAFAAVMGTVLIVPIFGQRAVEIDEVFLMHRSGVLIRHVSRVPGLRKDDDLVASMFVSIQEFVRDSFQTRATLDELSFGGRKASVLRGRHLVIAALLSRGHPRFLFPQLRAAERAIERAHGATLDHWDGRTSALDGVDAILQRLLKGGYRRFPGGPNT